MATTIGLLDFPNPKLPPSQNFPVSPLFGDDPAAWAGLNCTAGVEPLRGKALLIVTGQDGFNAQMNRNFHAHLAAAGIAHDFRQVAGGHDFPTVQATLPALLEFLENNLR